MRRQERHGESRTRLYKRWCSLKTRCDKPDSQDYVNYGGRGIAYHPDFEMYTKYRDYILSLGYERGTDLQIDRIDNDGDYTYGNLRMATRSENQCNKRAYGEVPFKGVSFDKSCGKYMAQTKQNGKRRYLGYFTTAFEAACAVSNYTKGELL
jgi:hypothetical protein